MKKLSNNSGFSLVEILFAMTILLGLALASVSLAKLSSDGNRYADRKSAQSSLAQLTIENLRQSIATFIQKALATEARQMSDEVSSTNVIQLNAEAAQDMTVVEVNIAENGTLKSVNEVLKGSEASKLFTELIEKMNVTKFVNIGPSNALASSNDELLESVTVIDSIEADPILNWFWQGLRPHANSYAV